MNFTINNRFTITNYDIQNQAFHFNNRAVNFYLDFSFLCRPIWWNATVSPATVSPLSWYYLGERC